MALSQRELNQALKIKRRFEQWPVTLDQNVLRAIQEQVKVLETAQSHARVLRAAVRKISNQWLRVDIPPLIQNPDLVPFLSLAKATQKGLPQIHNMVIPSINLPTITQPPHNSMIASFPYTGFTVDSNLQYTDNEEESPDSATDIESSVEYSGRYCNYQGRLGQDWITVEANLTAGITFRINISSLLEIWSQHRWEPIIWIVLEWLS